MGPWKGPDKTRQEPRPGTSRDGSTREDQTRLRQEHGSQRHRYETGRVHEEDQMKPQQEPGYQGQQYKPGRVHGTGPGETPVGAGRSQRHRQETGASARCTSEDTSSEANVQVEVRDTCMAQDGSTRRTRQNRSGIREYQGQQDELGRVHVTGPGETLVRAGRSQRNRHDTEGARGKDSFGN